MPGDNQPEEIAQRQQGPHAVTDATPVSTYQGLFAFQPDRPLTGGQEFSAYNAWYERNGGVAGRSDNDQLYRLTTDGTQTNSEAVLETAQIGLYRPGTNAIASSGTWVDVEPTGDAYYDIGYFSDSSTEGFYFRISGGYQMNFRVESSRYTSPIDISEAEMELGTVTEKTDDGNPVGRVYGLDPWAKNGPRRDTFDDEGYILGQTIGWYGPSSVMGWFVDVGDFEGSWVQRVWPLFLYRPVEGPAIQNPNLPVSVRANNGTSGQDLSIRVGGRQFSIQGDVPVNPEPTFHYADNQTIPWDTGSGPRNWNVAAVLRRKPTGRGTALGMGRLEVTATNEPIVFMTRVGEMADLTGTTDFQPPLTTEPEQSAVEVDCQTDTPDRLSWAEKTLDDGTVVPAGDTWSGRTGGTLGPTGKSTRGGAGSIEETFSYPFVREHPTVILVASRSSSDAVIQTEFELTESG